MDENSSCHPNMVREGRTVLIPKEGCQGRPEQYRPITCLNTSYKLLTAVLTEVLYDHVIQYDILPKEQYAIRRGRRGCLDALLVDSAVSREAKRKRKSLSVAWIDYQKAYDRVPQDWLQFVLMDINPPAVVTHVVGELVRLWQTVFFVGAGKDAVQVELKYRRGLFQGDSLSPLLYCLSIAPLSTALRSSGGGFRLEHGDTLVSHLCFMDDVKVFAKDSKQLGELLGVVDRVSESIGMKLGLRKCAVAHIERGKLVKGEDYELDQERKIERVPSEGTYKYLGIAQVFQPDHKSIRDRLTRLYAKRLHQIWSSALSSKHKVHATNTWAVALFRYFFCQVKWPEGELDKLDRLTRRVLRRHKAHHAGASLERLYLNRASGGRGLVNLRHAWEREVVSGTLYLAHAARGDELLRAVVGHQSYYFSRTGYSMAKKAVETVQSYGIFDGDLAECIESGEHLPQISSIVEQLKAAQAIRLIETLTAKTIHGVYYQTCLAPENDTAGCHAWLMDGRVRAETEALVVAAQDGVLHTNRYQAEVLRNGTDPQCRVCRNGVETIGHILSICEAHTWFLIKERHDRVVYQMVLALARSQSLAVPDSWGWRPQGWQGVGVLEGDKAKLVVDVSMPTERDLTARRPDIIVYLKERNQVVILEVAVAWETLLEEREKEKSNKYRELAADLATQHPGWRVDILPIVVGSLGTLRSFRSNIERLKLFSRKEILKLTRDVQFEVICFAVRLIRQHFSSGT